MSVSEEDVVRLLAYIKATLPEPWKEWPGGWPGQIEAALIDAVLSIRARYGGPTSGVRAAVKRYRSRLDGGPLDDLRRLAGQSDDALAAVLDNHQTTGGVPKAAAIIQAASRLVRAGVVKAIDLDSQSAAHRSAYCGTRGLGPVTWEYFTMLLGHPGVKADTWVIRYVSTAVCRRVSADEARELVIEAARRLEKSSTQLEHAIWDYIRRHWPSLPNLC